eukprot:GCRY01000922.1.p1 GENE.GCRY01000922.1~~GCRY01000922.1.p1  ORF type:complete len:414 (-),score=86.07 GCRY01000922.1:736-1977(-)
MGSIDRDSSWPETFQLLTNETYFKPPHADRAWEHWKSLGKPKYALGPMVEQSELPFRLLVKNYGVGLRYTPMLHSTMFTESKKYRESNFTTCPEDRPVIAQFNGFDPQTVVEAAKYVEKEVDAVDLNLGCAQGIARRGHYGSYLAACVPDWPVIEEIVRQLSQTLSCPVWCKIRVFDDVNKTIAFARMLEHAGASLVAVHGRTKEMIGPKKGLASYPQIKAVREALSVPVIGNGNIRVKGDADHLLRTTGVACAMSAEGLLHDPALFAPLVSLPSTREENSRGVLLQSKSANCQLAKEYLALAREYPCSLKAVRAHMFRMFVTVLGHYPDLRDRLSQAPDLAGITAVVADLAERPECEGLAVREKSVDPSTRPNAQANEAEEGESSKRLHSGGGEGSAKRPRREPAPPTSHEC